jgi:hypothetical protein
MALIISNAEQGTDEWRKARIGHVTASGFDAITARKRDGKPTAAYRAYLLQIVGEILTGEAPETFGGNALARGKEMEAEARQLYEFQTDNACELVGHVYDDVKRAGASPDSLISTDGMIEIKTKAAHLQLQVLIDDVLPEDHVAQVQGALWVTGRAWCDFVSYWPRLPLFVKRVTRDEAYIARLAVEVTDFNAQIDALVKRFQK